MTDTRALTEGDENARTKMLAAFEAKGLSAEDAERAFQRVLMRLGGATHDEALAAYPRLEPRRDRDGVIR